MDRKERNHLWQFYYLSDQYLHVSLFKKKNVEHLVSSFLRKTVESCHVLNGQCGDICIPQQDTHTCTCDLGLQLQNDSTSCDSSMFYIYFEKNKEKYIINSWIEVSSARIHKRCK